VQFGRLWRREVVVVAVVLSCPRAKGHSVRREKSRERERVREGEGAVQDVAAGTEALTWVN